MSQIAQCQKLGQIYMAKLTLIYKLLKKRVLEKTEKNHVKVGFGKIKIKTWFVLFLNVFLILELIFCNPNLAKLVYQTLLS